jgi:hypothetical protein
LVLPALAVIAGILIGAHAAIPPLLALALGAASAAAALVWRRRHSLA